MRREISAEYVRFSNRAMKLKTVLEGFLRPFNRQLKLLSPGIDCDPSLSGFKMRRVETPGAV